MAERKYLIEEIDPSRFFGPYNSYFKVFKAKYPALSLSSRGGEITIKGEDYQTDEFIKVVESIVKYLKINKQVSLGDIERVVQGEENPKTAENGIIIHGQSGKVISARTKNQQELVDKVYKNDLVFAIGPAGTGKTYTAVALAVRALKNKEVKKIILCRPAVEAGESLGFLPGDMKDKVDPYLRPLYDALGDMIPVEKYKAYIEKGIIEVAPLAFMRGRTLNNCFAILDEGQNATNTQLKMFLTRMGPISKVVVTGDLTQIDLPPRIASGLEPALNMLKGVKGIGIVKLNENDVVRHRLVKDIIKAYNKGT
ncbi:PhoH family protein [Bacteroidia bacterium]|nr:PhoH family protein [Bacteroidia bacterium]MDB4107750.1 PhoH family protein [Bacteroidia bacterium]MDB9881657.1 PhoH family protein [Bacteroidia bacterium]